MDTHIHVQQYTEALLDHRALCKHQHGFLYGRLCLTNLLEFLDNWTALLATGNVVDIVFLDLHKAFDVVSHKWLTLKLFAYRIQDKIAIWLNVCLEGRFSDGCVKASHISTNSCYQWCSPRVWSQTLIIYTLCQ